MKETFELSPEGQTKIDAVDRYIEDTLRAGRPIEVLIATRKLGEIANDRSKEAARVATDGSWSWADVGKALGMSKQAAHEKLRSRVLDEIDKAVSKLEGAEQAGHAKIAKRAARARQQIDRAAPFSPKVESARQHLDEWEQGKHDKLTRQVEKARKTVAEAEKSVEEKLNRTD